MADDARPYWLLISVLFSSFPLTPEIAMRLHRSAYDLYRTDSGLVQIDQDSDVIISGEVENLKRQVSLGTFTGPMFEARVETERGKGVVRFLLTHQGIEMMAERAAKVMN